LPEHYAADIIITSMSPIFKNVPVIMRYNQEL
jgi:hypothetical protein